MRYEHPPDKIHKSFVTVLYLAQHPPVKFLEERSSRSPFPACVGGKENIIEGDTVESYKRYYMSPKKQRLASWKTQMPDWYIPNPEHFQKYFEEKRKKSQMRANDKEKEKGVHNSSTTKRTGSKKMKAAKPDKTDIDKTEGNTDIKSTPKGRTKVIKRTLQEEVGTAVQNVDGTDTKKRKL
eukprot:TRINITY_DN8897_c4_g1_i2.p1 TRINITY_DN8897_c4_g1~~TRINITY_DN8897_c4_g1_i2.p1  ORF type:complete len:181 (+),score=35.53 TRINITY_DN8897_c4_g1_i2:346-888(+)